MSIERLRALPATVDVVTAGQAFGFGRAKAYRLAREGHFPCKITKVGRNYRVLTIDLHRALGVDAS
ncbi:hypothetical protein [Actinomadura macra]|uniref:hypothetical protein n=1 Tax=Actinomadura macra TaxID=46164 RepID=UPI00082B9FA8|nr:hypothetical protein [Actinomadura macra]